eukprot:656935-Prymnesium_polylepis.1
MHARHHPTCASDAGARGRRAPRPRSALASPPLPPPDAQASPSSCRPDGSDRAPASSPARPSRRPAAATARRGVKRVPTPRRAPRRCAVQ